MAALRQLAAELHLERVTGEVVDKDAHVRSFLRSFAGDVEEHVREFLAPLTPVETGRAAGERMILQGVEALSIIDYRHNALGQHACVCEHEMVGPLAQRDPFDRTGERRNRYAPEDVVQDLQLEPTAEWLGDDADDAFRP